MNNESIRQGVAEAFGFWLSQNPVSMGDVMESSVKSGVENWLSENGDELVKEVAKYIRDRYPKPVLSHPLRLIRVGQTYGVESMCCPFCGEDYSHIRYAHTLLGSDDCEARIYPGTVQGGETKSRRSALAIGFDGECEHSWEVVIQQHKGVNFVLVEEIEQIERGSDY